MKPLKTDRRAGRGFILLEALLAVAIFSLGVFALGHCVSNCLAAERLKFEDALAQRALSNRFAEIIGGATPVAKETTEELKQPFEGWKLKQTAVPLQRSIGDGEKLAGLMAVTLEVSWVSSGETQRRISTFYVRARDQ